jgi:hypothetical protein
VVPKTGLKPLLNRYCAMPQRMSGPTRARRPMGSRLRWPMMFLAWRTWSVTSAGGGICRTMDRARFEQVMARAPKSACNSGLAAQTACRPGHYSNHCPVRRPLYWR